MIGYLSRFTEVSTRVACIACDQEFIVVLSSLLKKLLPHFHKIKYCVFCGERIEWDAIQAAPKIEEEKDG